MKKRGQQRGSTPASLNLSKGYRRFLESTANRGPTPDEQKLFNKWDREFAKRKPDVVTSANGKAPLKLTVDDPSWDGGYVV